MPSTETRSSSVSFPHHWSNESVTSTVHDTQSAIMLLTEYSVNCIGVLTASKIKESLGRATKIRHSVIERAAAITSDRALGFTTFSACKQFTVNVGLHRDRLGRIVQR